MQACILEGFYGKAWSFKQRQWLLQLLGSDLNDFLAVHGGKLNNPYKRYCYAPKSEASLRAQGQSDWSQQQFRQLDQLIQDAKRHNIEFYIGFSPLGIYELWHQQRQAAEAALMKRCEQFKRLDIDGIGLFFDDMPASQADSAAVQVAICDFIASQLNLPIVLCPSYYSFDPILEELFGARPEHYWLTLGHNLPDELDVFWTGDKVISQQYPALSIKPIADQLQRKVTVWDNSGVHDGKKTADFLPWQDRFQLSELPTDYVSGAWLNPANAFSIAMLQLVVSVGVACGGQVISSKRAVLALIDQRLAAWLDSFIGVFTEQGLSQLSAAEKQHCSDSLSKLLPIVKQQHSDNPLLTTWLDFFQQDILSWLDGHFVFDPACLTG